MSFRLKGKGLLSSDPGPGCRGWREDAGSSRGAGVRCTTCAHTFAHAHKHTHVYRLHTHIRVFVHVCVRVRVRLHTQGDCGLPLGRRDCVALVGFVTPVDEYVRALRNIPAAHPRYTHARKCTCTRACTHLRMVLETIPATLIAAAFCTSDSLEH